MNEKTKKTEQVESGKTENLRIGDMLMGALKDHGVELRDQGRSLQAFAATRAAHLATIADQPGFSQAVRAEADIVALEAAKQAVRAGVAADQRVVGIIQAVLSIGLRLPPAPAA